MPVCAHGGASFGAVLMLLGGDVVGLVFPRLGERCERHARPHLVGRLFDREASGTEAASHADPRTTMRYDRARVSLDRHATYIVATFIAGAAR
jgi:hypothetical protein